jgi:hypothetical protein
MNRLWWYGLLAIGVIIAIVMGVVAWYAYSSGYYQASNDLTPLIHPEQGPLKIKPETPGGLKVPHQNRLVYNLVGPNTPPPKVESLMALPEKPLPHPAPIPLEEKVELPSLEPNQSLVQNADPLKTVLQIETQGQEGQAKTIELKKEDIHNQLSQFDEEINQAISSISQPEAALKKDSLPTLKMPEPLQPKDIVQKTTLKEPNSLKTVEDKNKKEAKISPPPKKMIRMQLAVSTEANVAKTLSNLRKKLGPALKGIPLNAVPMDMGGNKGIIHKIYAGPLDRGSVFKLCEQLKNYGQGCVLPKK